MPKRILVVDDDPIVLKLAKDKLHKDGYLVETASNGEVALHIVGRMPVHLILTDIVMPQMDGVDLFKSLRKDVKTMGIPVIVLTENERYRELFGKLGVDVFLDKPLDTDRLLKVIRGIFRDEEGHQKILICGAHEETINDMSSLIEGAAQKTMIARGGAEALSMALAATPKLILVDLMISDVTARELVRALRCFIRFQDTILLTYTHFSPEQMTDVDAVEQMRQTKDECQEAGATRYVGRFSGPTFLDTIRPYL